MKMVNLKISNKNIIKLFSTEGFNWCLGDTIKFMVCRKLCKINTQIFAT